MNLNEWMASLIRSFDEIAGRVQLYLPSVLGAIGLLILGWLAGRLLRTWSVRLMARVERRFEGHALRSASARLGVERSASEVIGSFVFWAVFIVFLGAATDTLGLPVLATWLSGLSRFLPRLLLAALIVLAGILAGTLARDAIAATGITVGRTLGRGTQLAIMTAAVITAVDQIGIDSRFLTGAIMIALAAFLGGTALAFGLGARTAASNIIAVHYVRQTYRVGQRVRLGDVEGTIREITSTSVVLETNAGRLLVPAKTFGETLSTLVTVEG
jgi:small-conductance mechanosensitive channel